MTTQATTVTLCILAALLVTSCEGDEFSAGGSQPDGNDSGVGSDSAAEADSPSTADGGADSDVNSDGDIETAAGDADLDAPTGDAWEEGGADAADDGGGDASDAAGDDASDAGPPECSGAILGCFGSQPKVCSGDKWLLSGGTCNYACTSGKCECSAPGRFISSAYPYPFTDTKTGLHWRAVGSGAGTNYTDATAYCVAILGGYRMPTVSEVQAILAQNESAIFCDPNFDPVIKAHLELQAWAGLTTTEIFMADVWTSDTTGSLQRTVNLKSGGTGTRDPATKIINFFFCVK